ncbi:MAG TPA: oxygenase MpaB family protein [Arthrobacter sp.]|nr:oxygenase MpaB family protein [Arthrobacter sp.]
MRNVLREFQAELRHTFTGSRTTAPEWVARLEEGDDAGFHLPGSAVWAVHGGMPTIVAGIRALLMQSLHPGALAGVHDHSRFREDPLGRLAGTIRWIFTVTYGSSSAATDATGWVLRLHESVRGEYADAHGTVRPYAANDPELLRWVHIAFTDAFLTAHTMFGPPIPGGPDAYVREWAHAGTMMGVESPPVSEAQMRRQLRDWYDGGHLAGGSTVDETVGFIRNPPLHPALRPGYRVLFAAAVASLEPHYREMLGLRTARLGPFPLPVKLATRVTLAVVHLALGKVGPSELAARARLRRLGFGY